MNLCILFLEVPVVSAALCTCERIKILQSLFSIFISYQFVPAGSPQSASLRNNFYANVTYLALHFLFFFVVFLHPLPTPTNYISPPASGV